MNNETQILLIKTAHQKYIDWWSPIDIASGSLIAPMNCHRFCESLLIYPDDWFTRWLGNVIPNDKIIDFKQNLMKLIIHHHTNKINLNE